MSETFYDAVGGHETFQKLVHRFYEQVAVDTEFRKLATWDSFLALALIYGIEERFGVLIGYGTLATAVTVADLLALVRAGAR